MYSGHKSHMNDPSSTSLPRGPLPQGKYKISQLIGRDHRDWFLDPGFLSKVGYSLGLNRGAFMLHLRNGGSDGCITGASGESDGNFGIINIILNLDIDSGNSLEVVN
jgi:hypothetical protein